MSERPRLGASDALYLKPLLSGLDGPDSPFQILSDIPAGIAHKFNERPEDFRGAFLSPIDYGRHGGEYLILPRMAVSSSTPTQTVELIINDNVSEVRSMAVDIRVTSEIILAKIILLEKFTDLSREDTTVTIVPMLPDSEAMLTKADAALIARVGAGPQQRKRKFSIDLVEEWMDLTDLPYVHGVWVVREDHFSEKEALTILEAKEHGVKSLSLLSARWADAYGMTEQACLEYLSSFSFELREEEELSLSEFFRYAYYHGVLGDVPELNFMPVEFRPPPSTSPN